MDDLLNESGVGQDLVCGRTTRHGTHSDKQAAWLLSGFRCAIARRLLDAPYREFAFRLADSALLQWFCRCGEYGIADPASKSTIWRLERTFAVDEVENLVRYRSRNADSSGALSEALQ